MDKNLMIYFVNTIFMSDADTNSKEFLAEKERIESLDYPEPMNLDDVPRLPYFIVSEKRTPVMFTDFKSAQEFVEKDSCDWQECGYYNYAHIQGITANCCYPDPEYNVAHFFFSCEEWEWVKCEVERKEWLTLKINGKPVYKISEDGSLIEYNGTIDIG